MLGDDDYIHRQNQKSLIFRCFAQILEATLGRITLYTSAHSVFPNTQLAELGISPNAFPDFKSACFSPSPSLSYLKQPLFHNWQPVSNMYMEILFQITCLHISNSNSGAKYQIWFFRISLVSPGKQGSIVHILTSAVHQRPQFSAALPPPANGRKMLKFQQQKIEMLQNQDYFKCTPFVQK